MEGGSRNTMANTARDRDITRQSSVSQNLDKRTLNTETCKGKRNLQCGSVLRWTSVLGHSHREKSDGKFVDTRQVSPIFTLLFMTKK